MKTGTSLATSTATNATCAQVTYSTTTGIDLTSISGEYDQGTGPSKGESSGTPTTYKPSSTLRTSTTPDKTADAGEARPLCLHNPVLQDPPNCTDSPSPTPPAVISCSVKAAPTTNIWQYSPDHFCKCNTNTENIYPTITSKSGDEQCDYGGKTLPSNIYLSQIVTSAAPVPEPKKTCSPNWNDKTCECSFGPGIPEQDVSPLDPGTECGDGFFVPDNDCKQP